MNNQVGAVVAEVMEQKPNVTVTPLPSMIRVDAVGKMDVVYAEIDEALGEERLLRRRRVRGEHVDPLRADDPRGRPDDHVRQSRGRRRVLGFDLTATSRPSSTPGRREVLRRRQPHALLGRQPGQLGAGRRAVRQGLDRVLPRLPRAWARPRPTGRSRSSRSTPRTTS